MSKRNKTKRAVKAGLTPGTAFKFDAESLSAPQPPRIKTKLYDSIKASYGDQAGINALEAQGFKKDKELSNGNSSVFYNERTKQLQYDIAGTHNMSALVTDAAMGIRQAFSGKFSRAGRSFKRAANNDLLTDAALLGGNLEDTHRYKEAQDILGAAKKKYAVDGDAISIRGHSLGGAIAERLAGENKQAQVITYNKGVGLDGLFRGNASNEKAYVTPGDVISLLANGKKGTKYVGRGSTNPLEAHSSENLKNSNLFV